MKTFSCGHTPQKKFSLYTIEDEKMEISTCNGCYDNHKSNFDKFNFEEDKK